PDLRPGEADVARQALVDRDPAQRPPATEAVLLLDRHLAARRRLREADEQLERADRARRPQGRRRRDPPAEADEVVVAAERPVVPVDEQAAFPLVGRIV